MIMVYTDQVRRADERLLIMSVLSERLRDLMKKRGLNQKDLAAKAGATQPSISNYLRGHAPRPEAIASLATALETTTDYLLGQTNDEHQLTDTERSLVEAFRLGNESAIDDILGSKFDDLFANDPTFKTTGHDSDS